MHAQALISELFTDRLVLRGLTENDIEAYERHFIDYEVIRHLSAVISWPYPKGGIRSFICDQVLPMQGKDRWVWGLHLKETEELIGSIDLRREGSRGNRGFWLGRPFWGRGYMTEAVIRVTDFAFQDLGFDHLVFTNAVGNQRSHNIKARMGAVLMGVAPTAFVTLPTRSTRSGTSPKRTGRVGVARSAKSKSSCHDSSD
ncbi:GNAT family N-acetyltransferase [Azospirillum thiophilum]|uniref:GNAT family N-acetyltransferase n=1 Tax=Azospirillum thiophilum TaxID=528244 RepID=UPI0009E3A253|nr:GNAT family N-acetyltransferase [Azospirillum thiophilum]